MKILELTAENVKRLKVVQIKPDGNLVVIGGKNGQGKTSVLDSIMFALGGKGTLCEQPIRQGEEKASIVCDLGELVVTRTFTESGSYLKVCTKDGSTKKSPQDILDKLTSGIGFDPLQFTRQKPDAQVETLRTLVGLDFSKLDAASDTAYENRKLVNRDIALIEAQLKAMPEHEAPAEEVSVSGLMAQLNEAEGKNSQNHLIRENLRGANTSLEAAKSAVSTKKAHIEQLKSDLVKLETEEAKVSLKCASVKEQVEKLQDVDVSTIKAKIEQAAETNKKVSANGARKRKTQVLETQKKASANFTQEIEAATSEKAKQLASVKFPLPGMSFNATGVLLNNLPFSQASAAEQLRASVAIGLALNPSLRVILIRDGSLLDNDSLMMVSDMAVERDAQIWIERVGSGVETSVIIEDGQVKEMDEFDKA